MRSGIAPRLVLSHLLTAVLGLGVFIVVLLAVTEAQATAAGQRADQATAVQLAPWMARFYRERGSWDGLLTMLDDARELPHMPMMRGPMVRRVPAIDQELRALLDQPILVLSRAGEVLAARNVGARIVEMRRGDLDRAVPVGDAERPLGYLFVGSMVHPDANPLRALFVRTTRTAAGVTALVVLIATAAASLLWTRWLARPLRALSGAASAMARGEYRTRVQVPPQRDELSDLAEAFNTMAAQIETQEEVRRRFVADAAHELRTPLSLVSARVEMLACGVYAPDEEQWRALQAGMDRMQGLVEDLQTLSRLESGRISVNLRAVDAGRLLSRVMAAFEPVAATRGVRIRIEGESYPAWADPARMEQVLGNLLGNAIRYSPAGGSITLAAESTADGLVALRVEDEGPGIPEADRERVFDRFVRLDDSRDRAGGGSGLGLAIAAELVRLQNGRIRVEDARQGSGARFVVEVAAEDRPTR